MDQRVAFIADGLRDEWTMTALAERYAISRKTGYKWVARYEADPGHGLAERSRAPTTHGRAMADEVREAVLAVRRGHPYWGPKKLRAVLAARAPGGRWPAASTVGDLWRREGLSPPRRRTRYVVPVTQPLAAAQAPNDVWSADFKGWFRTADGTRCDPLTVTDAWSRFVWCCRIVVPSERGVRPWCERTFREHGLPRALRTDNGAPFASTGAARLTHLAVWWLSSASSSIGLIRAIPNRTAATSGFTSRCSRTRPPPPATTARRQQRRFDRMRREFNAERPHEALGQRPPARVYVPSPRPYPARREGPWYDATHQVRRVKPMGQIKWRGASVFVSEAVRGELVGLAETERGDWVVRFMQVEFGRIDRQSLRVTSAWHGRRLG